MISYTEKTLGFIIGKQGKKQLVGKVFSNQQFKEIALGPVKKAEQTYEVVNCKFINCKISPGLFVVRNGILLKNVLFQNVSSGDCLTISSNTFLDNVVLRGKHKKGGLWVKPSEVFDEKLETELKNRRITFTNNIKVMLDIVDYEAPEIAILGIPSSKVAINPDKHVVIKRSWKNEINWGELGIGPTSFWRIRLKYLRGFSVEEGVYGLPLKNNKKYKQVMDEHSHLRSLGFV